jgi:D-galacturonate reductase
MRRNIGEVYSGMDLTCDTYPSDDAVHPTAYLDAVSTYAPGDVAIVFTPDDTHHDIAMAAVRRGMHVMVTKPIVQTLEQHRSLSLEARERGVLVVAEVHKRWDPFYADARDRARSQFGNFQYLYAYMSQPKHQLETFRAWAGKSSDISYYLNSHHVDYSEWTLEGIARPVRVAASSSTGVAKARGMDTEDSITLTVTWENLNDGTTGTAVYTSSWAAPRSDVHSQQRFFYMGTKGEITVDQAHRGMTVAVDDMPFASVNPLFMKYAPTNGVFSGQGSYGIRSIECFVDACREINAGRRTPGSYDDGSLATVGTTMQGTAILEAGRRSLDADGRPMDIVYNNMEDGGGGHNNNVPVDIRPHEFRA